MVSFLCLCRALRASFGNVCIIWMTLPHPHLLCGGNAQTSSLFSNPFAGSLVANSTVGTVTGRRICSCSASVTRGSAPIFLSLRISTCSCWLRRFGSFLSLLLFQTFSFTNTTSLLLLPYSTVYSLLISRKRRRTNQRKCPLLNPSE